jgi:hypothetical protein
MVWYGTEAKEWAKSPKPSAFPSIGIGSSIFPSAAHLSFTSLIGVVEDDNDVGDDNDAIYYTYGLISVNSDFIVSKQFKGEKAMWQVLCQTTQCHYHKEN